MQWRLIDRITSFQAWHELRADKVVSLEEYYLRERLGQPGELPETLLFEACIQAARWLIAASSGFTLNALVESVSGFTIKQTLGPGEKCNIAIMINDRNLQNVTVVCRGHIEEEEILGGEIVMTVVPLEDYWIPGERESLWSELFRSGREI